MLYLFQVYLVVLAWVLALGVVLFVILGLLWLAFRTFAVLVRGGRLAAQTLATSVQAAAELEVQIQRRMTVALERFPWK